MARLRGEQALQVPPQPWGGEGGKLRVVHGVQEVHLDIPAYHLEAEVLDLGTQERDQEDPEVPGDLGVGSHQASLMAGRWVCWV